MADNDDFDPTQSSGQSAAGSTGEPHGAHAIEPAVSGVPPHVDEPTFRDRERLAAEGVEPADHDQRGGDHHDEHADDEHEHEDHDKELVTVGARERSAVARRDGSATVVGRSKKDRATPPQRRPVDQRRTGPVTFVKESVGELQKVVYPTGQQLVNYFVVVLIFVLFIIAIVSVLDLAFGAAILKIFS